MASRLRKLPYLLTFLTLLALFVISPAAMAGRPDSTEWVLDQYSPNGGPCTVYLSENAAKIASKQYGFDIICKAPDWKVHAVRRQEKKEWVGDLDHFGGGMLMDPLADKPNPNKTVTTPAKVEIADGVRCRKYITKTEDLEQLWAAQDISVHPKICEFLCHFYEAANIPQVLIHRLVYEKPLRKGEKLAFLLDLKKSGNPGYKVKCKTIAWKKTSFNAHDFDIPKCTKLTRLGEITFSKNKKEDITRAIESLGFQSNDLSKP